MIARLLEKDLIRECGTLDAPGRPALFETTVTFLKEFGFSSVHDLPPMDMLMYKTLQDIEDSVTGAAGAGNDVQITIEQLAATIRTKDIQNYETVTNMTEDSDQDPGELSDTNVMDISSAFFGEE